MHAPPYAFRGMEMNDELNTQTFFEKSKYKDADCAKSIQNICRSCVATSACIFATRHRQAAKMLMDLMEETGLVTYVGK